MRLESAGCAKMLAKDGARGLQPSATGARPLVLPPPGRFRQAGNGSRAFLRASSPDQVTPPDRDLRHSPDPNPIAHRSAERKALLRSAARRTVEGLWNLVGTALRASTGNERPNDTAHWGHSHPADIGFRAPRIDLRLGTQ
jgi:hypothetical protein